MISNISDKSFFHIHTFRCRHAQEVLDEAYIAKAIELGGTDIWFTDHAPFPGNPFGHRMRYEELEEYLSTLYDLKEQYKDRINIHIGLETEYFPSYDAAGYYRQLKADPRLELLLLGQHMAEESGGYSFSWTKEELNEREFLALGHAIIAGIQTGYFGAVAHPDRIFRRRRLWNEEMQNMACSMIDAAAEKRIPLEINMESVEYERQFWPEFWALVGRDIPILYGLDAHSVDEMECRMKNAHGIKIMAIRQGHPLWDKTISFARSCSWKAGQFLAAKMQNNDFAEWERVIVATRQDLIAGFCTLTEKDELPEDSGFSPFIGFMFVDERFRGHRISEKMIEYACNYAKELGYSKVYIMSGEQGLYEKYGFRMLGEYVTIYGTTDQLFEMDLL